jgi:hypothetical protein
MKKRRNIVHDGKNFKRNEKKQTPKLNLWLEKRRKTKLSTAAKCCSAPFLIFGPGWDRCCCNFLLIISKLYKL